MGILNDPKHNAKKLIKQMELELFLCQNPKKYSQIIGKKHYVQNNSASRFRKVGIPYEANGKSMILKPASEKVLQND